MNAPVLTLPAPAAELWKRIAPAVREEIGRITGGEPQYAIGGGSILAARWKHRHSYDVDLVVPPDTPLGMLATANNAASQFEPRLRALGGTPTFSSELEHDFEAAGLNAYLHTRGPGGKALVDYARTACAANRNGLVFEADAERVRAWRTATAGMNLPSGAADEQRDPGSPRSAARG